MGCIDGNCTRTHTCDPHSSCASCDDLSAFAVMQGIEISNNWTAGLWTFKFALSSSKTSFTAVDVTDPAGTATHYAISKFTRESATFSAGGVDHGVRFDGFGHNGALGRNLYLALAKEAAVPAFGKESLYTAGNVEFALLSCQVDGAQRTVSGQNNPITCKVGALH